MEVNGNQMYTVFLIFFEDNYLYLLKVHIKLGLMRIQMTQLNWLQPQEVAQVRTANGLHTSRYPGILLLLCVRVLMRC